MLPVVLREAARRDLDEALDHYLSVDARAAAAGFLACVERTIENIARYPQAGSPRYGHVLDLPGLRAWILDGYPYLVFYVERRDHVDVWRVPHAERNIPDWMSGEAR